MSQKNKASVNLDVDTYNIFAPGRFRDKDEFPVVDVISGKALPMLFLKDCSLGYILKLKPHNASTWGEAERESLISRLATKFKKEDQRSPADYTYTFLSVRRAMAPEELENFRNEENRLSAFRIDHAKSMSESLDLQSLDFYIGIVGSPSQTLKSNKAGLSERFKSIFSSDVKTKIENSMIGEVAVEFADHCKHIVASLANEGISVELPQSEQELLEFSRQAFRPNYISPLKGSAATSPEHETANYKSAADYMLADMSIEQYKDFWISDGCLQILFSMYSPPHPNRRYQAVDTDKILKLGIRPGVSITPYVGSYSVSWSSLSREQGDTKFRWHNALSSSLASDKKGIFEDKASKKRAREADMQHEAFIEGDTDMVRASVTYHLSIPLSHLPKFVSVKDVIDERDAINSLKSSIISQLNDVGYSEWVCESPTHYSVFMNKSPGCASMNAANQSLPRLYTSLEGALHLIPLFSTVGPDQNKFNGSNYFTTDENSLFVFDHFSKNNGPAANFGVCGATGSGKSVLCQSLIMMTETIKPQVMIMDFGGGNVGSWAKLCALWGGVELKFGAASPPKINPFELSLSDALPNQRKISEVAIMLGEASPSRSMTDEIRAIYNYFRNEYNPHSRAALVERDLRAIMPILESYSLSEILNYFRLRPGYSKPGQKGVSSIRLILELLLCDFIDESGPKDNPWASFSLDDINEAISHLYEDFLPEKPMQWPTLSDFKQSIIDLHNHRLSIGSSSRGVSNFEKLISRLNNFTDGGLDPFLDGQTNVDITATKTDEHGAEKTQAAPFVLADMAGISDARKLAIYMVTVNEFMSGVLYSQQDRRGIIVRDEAWFFMNSAIAAPYLDADYRLARKYGFSVVTIAQQFSDFKSATLQNNTQNWFICSLQSDEEVNMVANKFKLNQREVEQFSQKKMGTTFIRDVFSGKTMDVYAKIFLANKSGRYFLRHKISRSERWITTTEPNEAFVFNYYFHGRFKGEPIEKLISFLDSGEYRKDADLARVVSEAGRTRPED